jgi:predicted metal-dependent peptidase
MNEIKFPPCEITKEQEKKWLETRVALSWFGPGFTHLFSTMLNPEKNKRYAYFTRAVPIAATDGYCMLANPDTFFEYDVLVRVAGCGHEILHAALNHPKLWAAWDKAGFITYPDGTKLPFDFDLMQIVGDHIVNDMLVNSKIGKIHETWWHNPAFINARMSCAEGYKIAYAANPPPPKKPPGQGAPCDQPNGDKGQGSGPPQPGQSDQPDPNSPVTSDSNTFDTHLKPGEAQSQDTPQAKGERSEEAWGVAMATAVEIEKKAGKDKLGLTQVFKQIQEPVVDWQDVLRALVARKLGADRYDWQRPDRRLIVRDIYAPSRSSFDTGTVVVAVDTSGSVINELDLFLGVVASIFSDMKPRELIILWCDAHVHDVDHCDDASDLEVIRRRGARGGGGTEFYPVFKWVKDNNVYPDLLIYLTDGQAWSGFPAAPSYPTIWGNIRPGSRYPWGDVIQVPKQARR